MIDNNLGYRPCSPYGLPISSSFGLFGSRALRCSRAECDDASFVVGSALEAAALCIVLRVLWTQVDATVLLVKLVSPAAYQYIYLFPPDPLWSHVSLHMYISIKRYIYICICVLLCLFP